MIRYSNQSSIVYRDLMYSRQVLDSFVANWPFFALGFAALILVKILGSSAFKGWFGEWRVRKDLSRLNPQVFRQFHDLYLPRPDGQGTTQIDHVLVSPFGIFVIETKNYKGWIFGSGKQAEWTQQIYKKKHRFQNPLRQNHLHVHSLVFFTGQNEFKTVMPDNVINHGLSAWITKHESVFLSSDAVQNASGLLFDLDRSTNRKSACKAHIAALETRLAR
jgi:restriction system protein